MSVFVLVYAQLVISLRLQQGADVFVRCRWTNMTPLHYAVFFDAAPVVKILLEHSNGIGKTTESFATEIYCFSQMPFVKRYINSFVLV